MADFEVDDQELGLFQQNLELFQKNFPKESKVMLRKVGNKAKTIILRKAKELVGKKTGRYYKSIKRGIVFKNQNGDLTVRVYPSKVAPHAHLLEFGHRIVRDGKEVGFVEGFHVFDKAEAEVESQMNTILASEFEKAISKL